ncbi:hypothetical protein ANHS_1715 [Ligilactobacillus ruminis ATCC 25644]|nr:hypothetical protein ANHS_1715 [Ligilactobacillus ruminis ATCC 25644]
MLTKLSELWSMLLESKEDEKLCLKLKPVIISINCISNPIFAYAPATYKNNPKQNASANLTGILTRLVEQHCIYQKEPF